MTDKIKILADELTANNVGMAFGVSGSGPSFKLINSLLQNGIDYWPLSHEASAAIAAGAYSFLSKNKTAIAVTIKGPGFANMLPGLAANFMERYAGICISEDYDDAVSNKKMHKRMLQYPLVQGMVGAVNSLNGLENFSNFLEQKKGNEMPLYFDLANTEVPAANAEPAAVSGSGNNVELIIDKIKASQTTVLIVGSLVGRLELDISTLQLPIFTTCQAKGIINEGQENAAGIYTGVGKILAPEIGILQKADCVISIGLRNYEILGVDAKKNFINVDIHHSFITDDDITFNENEINKIINALKNKSNWAAELINDCNKKLKEYVNQYQWMPGNVFEVINSQNFNHTLVLDTGTFCTIGEHIWLAKKGRTFIGSSNGRNLGLSIPTTIGAVAAMPAQPTFTALGDGGIRYYAADLCTISQRKLPVCILYMTDGRYGSIISNLPGFETNDLITTPQGNNWLEIAASMGYKTENISDTNTLKTTIENWDKKSPLFLQCAFDAEEYLSITLDLRG